MGSSNSPHWSLPISWQNEAPSHWPRHLTPSQCLAPVASLLVTSPSHVSTWVESLLGKHKVDSLSLSLCHHHCDSRSTEHLNIFSCELVPISALSILWGMAISSHTYAFLSLVIAFNAHGLEWALFIYSGCTQITRRCFYVRAPCSWCHQ